MVVRPALFIAKAISLAIFI